MSIKYHTPDNLTDSISSLPVDNNPPVLKFSKIVSFEFPDEIKILDTLFKENQNSFYLFFEGVKEVILAGLLFVLLSIPQTNEYIIRIFPFSQTSPINLLLVKTFLFMGLFFVLKNLYLIRKKK